MINSKNTNNKICGRNNFQKGRTLNFYNRVIEKMNKAKLGSDSEKNTPSIYFPVRYI